MKESLGKVLTKHNGLQLDHIGIVVNDIDKGVKYIEELTGVKPIVHPPRESEPYHSASLMIGEDNTLLEILSPNKKHPVITPLKSILKSFKQPKLAFWYISTDDFDSFEKKVESIGRKIEKKTVIKAGDPTKHSEYTRGMIGPGFSSIFPSVIHWHKRVNFEKTMVCPIKNFKLVSKDAKKINENFKALGITHIVQEGRDFISLSLETPNGVVKIENEAIDMSFSKILLLMFKDVIGLT